MLVPSASAISCVKVFAIFQLPLNAIQVQNLKVSVLSLKTTSCTAFKSLTDRGCIGAFTDSDWHTFNNGQSFYCLHIFCIVERIWRHQLKSSQHVHAYTSHDFLFISHYKYSHYQITGMHPRSTSLSTT